MKIEGPRAADATRKSDKTRKTSGSTSDFSSFLDTESEGTADVAAAPAMGGIGALIAAQAAEDPLEGRTRRRMQDRAEKVLDALDDVHRGLLSGSLSTVQMERIAQSVTVQREKVNDPRLVEILDQVDLRAQVELAKLEMARENS
jgi:hypothetical protein